MPKNIFLICKSVLKKVSKRLKQLSFYPINHCTFLFFFFFEKSLDPRFHDHFPGSSLLTLLNHKFNYSLFASERWKSLVLVGAKGGEWATPSIRNSPVRLLTRRSEGAKRWFIAHAPRWILDIRGGGGQEFEALADLPSSSSCRIRQGKADGDADGASSHELLLLSLLLLLFLRWRGKGLDG